MKSLKRLLEIAEEKNIADKLSDDRLSKIGSLCRDGYKIDLGTSEDHFKKIEEFIEIAKQIVVEKVYPWVGAANAKYPLLTVAAMQFNARALPALVPSSKIVTAKHIGEDTTGEKDQRAERISKHMSYQLSEEVEDWRENMDAMLLQIPIVGTMFKKTYRDTLKKKMSSSLLMPNQLVVNNDTTRTIESCPRVTEVLTRYPYQIKANIESGFWTDNDIKLKEEDEETPETILEQHVLMDIYGDGDKEPYIVTIHEDTGKVLRIRACFDEDTIFIHYKDEYISYGEVRRSIEAQNADINRKNVEAKMSADMAGTKATTVPAITFNLKDNKPICVEKIQYYTEFFYLQSFGGKYYKAGLGDLVASLSGLIDTTLNEMIDAGHLANLQGGLQQKSGKGPAGTISLKPGQFAPIETGGVPIRDSIYMFDFKGPSSVLFSLLGMLIDSARDITSVKDIMVGDAPAGETATTTMVRREEGMRVFSAIYLRLYRSLDKEFKKIYTLNRKYLNQKQYFLFGDTQAYIAKDDYEADGMNIRPAANPSESTMQERMIKAQALMNFVGDPDANPDEIRKNYIQAIGFEETEYARFFPGQQGPTPPSPEMLKLKAETEEIYKRIEKLDVEKALTYAKAIEAVANAESKELGTQLEIYRNQVEEFLENGLQPGGNESMAGRPEGQGGLPEIPQGMDNEGGAGLLEPGTEPAINSGAEGLG